MKETNKSSLLKLLINRENLVASSSIYLGDKLADYKAANDNNLYFIGADFTDNDLKSNNNNNFKIVNNLQEKILGKFLIVFGTINHFYWL